MNYGAIKSHVSNRGVPPDAFLAELIAWGRTAPEEIFAVNSNLADIYAWEYDVLGPWESILHRRAAMLEFMRVLAGFESSWKWTEGKDPNNHNPSPSSWEAGAWQVSSDSRSFGGDLKAISPSNPIEFQAAMKDDHPLAMEYIARLLRHTVRHNGPVLRHEIDPWLNRDAVKEFEQLLTTNPATTITEKIELPQTSKIGGAS